MRSPFIFSLSSTFLPSLLLPASCVDEGTVWVEREDGKAHIVVDLQARVRSPRSDTYFLQTYMLGTQKFLLVFLPIFFFGYDWLERG